MYTLLGVGRQQTADPYWSVSTTMLLSGLAPRVILMLYGNVCVAKLFLTIYLLRSPV